MYFGQKKELAARFCLHIDCFFSSNSYFSISQHSIAHILQQPTIEKDYNEIPHVQMLGIEYSSDLMPYT